MGTRWEPGGNCAHEKAPSQGHSGPSMETATCSQKGVESSSSTIGFGSITRNSFGGLSTDQH